MVLGLFDVLDRDQADAAERLVDDQQLFDPVLVEQALGLVPLAAFRHGDQVLVGHQFGDGLALVTGKAHVAVGQDADQLLAARFDHRNAADPVLLHQQHGVGQRRARIDCYRVDDHAGFVLFHGQNGGGLLFDAQIFVHHTDAARLRHGDGHGGFRDRVHGGRHQRDTNADAARNAGAGLCLERDDLRALGLEQNVVEGERVTNSHGEKVLALFFVSLGQRHRRENPQLWDLWVER